MSASAAPLQCSSVPRPRTRLPADEAELATACAFLLDEAVPLLMLTGPGGIGKTRLALAVARDVSGDFADCVVFVDLAPLADPSLVPNTVVAALQVPTASAASGKEAVLAQHQSTQCPLLLDNRERLLTSVG